MKKTAIFLFIGIGVLALKFADRQLKSSTPNDVATLASAVPSKSSNLILKLVQDERPMLAKKGKMHFVTFAIFRNDKSLLFQCPESFSHTHNVYAMWDHKDAVWVYSGDSGTTYWSRIDEATWTGQYAIDLTNSPPAFILQAQSGKLDD